METLDGKVVGRYDGIMHYTIGQRHGLGIGGNGEPWFVVGKNLERNVLYVEQGFHHEMLYSDSIISDNVSWISKENMPHTFECTAKFRYRKSDNKVTVVRLDDSKVKIIFPEKFLCCLPLSA